MSLSSKYFTSRCLTSLSLPSVVWAQWQRYCRQGLLLRKFRSLRDVCVVIWELKQPIRGNVGKPRRTLSGTCFHVWLSGMSVTAFSKVPLFSSPSILKRLINRFTWAAQRLVKIFRPAHYAFLWVVHSSDPTWLPRFTSHRLRPGNLEPCFHYFENPVRLSLFFCSHFLCLSVYIRVFLSLSLYSSESSLQVNSVFLFAFICFNPCGISRGTYRGCTIDLIYQFTFKVFNLLLGRSVLECYRV